MLYRSLIVGVVLSSVLFAVSYFLLKRSLLKAGIFSTLVLILFFGYGLIYDWMENLFWSGYWPFANIHRYLIIIYIIAILGLFFLVRKAKYTFLKLTPVLSVLLLLLICYNFVVIMLSPKSVQSNDTAYVDYASLNKSTEPVALPDIYYLILDGYASQNTLKLHYGYNNNDFISYLREIGFYVADSAIANYYFTPPSLATTFNMEYHEPAKDSLSLIENIRNNKVFHILKELGYTIHVVRSGYAVSRNFALADNVIYIDAINEFERALLRFSILRLDDLIGFIPYMRIKSQLEQIENFDKTYSSPKFLFSHIVCPHPPYVFDRQGNRKTRNSYGNNSWEPYEDYVEQLMYISNRTQKIVDNIISHYPSDKQPIIVLQADHGPFISAPDSLPIFQARSQIFSAIYIAQKDSLYPNISLVNTFPYIFKYGLGLPVAFQPDSAAGVDDFFRSPLFKNLYKKTENDN